MAPYYLQGLSFFAEVIAREVLRTCFDHSDKFEMILVRISSDHWLGFVNLGAPRLQRLTCFGAIRAAQDRASQGARLLISDLDSSPRMGSVRRPLMGAAPLPQRFQNSARDQMPGPFKARHMFASHSVKSVIFSAQARAIFRPRFS